MIIYQMKIKTKPYKSDEFRSNMRSLLPNIRKQMGCLGFSLNRDSEMDNTCSLIGEWQTRKAMEKHFGTHDFQVLIGAARVLGETFTFTIAEVLKTGGFELVREKIAQKGVKHQNAG